MATTQVRRQAKETVSVEVLHDKLPEACFDAVMNSLNNTLGEGLDDSVYRRYFDAEPTPVLTDEEQKELFEQLGNGWVKNHYSTAELRSLVEKPVVGKKIRRDE